jgi:hypothetical protein
MARRRLPFLFVDEVATCLRVDHEDVIGFVDRGELSALVLPDNTIRIAPADLDRFIRARTEPWKGWRARGGGAARRPSSSKPPLPRMMIPGSGRGAFAPRTRHDSAPRTARTTGRDAL